MTTKRDDPAAYYREWREKNRQKTREYSRDYHKKRMETSPEYCQMKRDASRWTRRKMKYGIDKDQYEALLIQQDGCCAICQEKRMYDLRVDHNHQTGEVRALLCANCNAGLGMFAEDPARIEAAIHYLQQEKVN